jgi:predicted HicB family RNase H-like nuclease
MSEKRERFETTLKPELKEKLKLVAIKRKKNINELIEEWIQNLKVSEK